MLKPIVLDRWEYEIERAAAARLSFVPRMSLSRRLHPSSSGVAAAAMQLYGATPALSVLRRKTLPGVRSFLPKQSQVIAQRESRLARTRVALALQSRLVLVG